MSGLGNKGAPVTCSTCDGMGQTLALNRRLEAVREICATCHGSGKIVATRRVQ